MGTHDRTPANSRIALVASGPLSGKSTLARYLAEEHGYVLACHVCTLVGAFVKYANEGNSDQITSSEVFEKKEQYRQALQDFSLQVGFSDPSSAGHWTELTLAEWHEDESRPVVFDSFRGEVQGDYMQRIGFVRVQLHISEDERKRRAAAMGKDYGDVLAAVQHHPELEKGILRPDVVLSGELPTVLQAQVLTSPTILEMFRAQQRERNRQWMMR